MTDFQVPARVAANIARRLAADARGRRCTYGCRAATRLYPCGVRCDEHAPWALAGRPDPVTQVDPTRTLEGIRAAAGLRADVSVLPSRPAVEPALGITDRFRAFHERNPHVYERVVELVTDAVLRGDTRIGVGALFEQLRYSERTETNGDRYRLNNDYRADMVRLLLAEHPEWAGLFELRERRTA